VKDVARGVAAGVVLQLTLGAPFLLHYPQSYVVRAFDFSRVRAAAAPSLRFTAESLCCCI
jgi:hypothetical protein